MSMHGSTAGLTPAAVLAITQALGPDPVIVVDLLTGDNRKGITNGVLCVVDEPHPQFVGTINNRVVKLGDNVVYGPILVAASDKLTSDKAANMLRSLAKVGGWSTRPPTQRLEAPDDIDPAEVRRLMRDAIRGDGLDPVWD